MKNEYKLMKGWLDAYKTPGGAVLPGISSAFGAHDQAFIVGETLIPHSRTLILDCHVINPVIKRRIASQLHISDQTLRFHKNLLKINDL